MRVNFNDHYAARIAAIEERRTAVLPVCPLKGAYTFPGVVIENPTQHFLDLAKTHFLALCARIGPVPPTIELHVVEVEVPVLKAYLPTIMAIDSTPPDEPMAPEALEWLAQIETGLDSWAETWFVEPVELDEADEDTGLPANLHVVEPENSAALALLRLKAKNRLEEAAYLRRTLMDPRVRDLMVVRLQAPVAVAG